MNSKENLKSLDEFVILNTDKKPRKHTRPKRPKRKTRTQDKNGPPKTIPTKGKRTKRPKKTRKKEPPVEKEGKY